MSLAAALSTSIAPAPAAGQLTAFIVDEPTQAAVRAALVSNWPTATINEGGFFAALETLQHEPSSSLMLVDVSDAENPVEAGRALLAACDMSSRLVLIGVHNDINVYRELQRAGVADYLVKPIDPQRLVDAIEGATRVTTHASPDSHKINVVAVVGARGGVGASTIAVNTAWMIAHELGKTVTLLDLDLQFGTVALSLDLEPSNGLREAFENPDRVDGLFIASAMTHESERLYVMSAEEPLEDECVLNPSAFDLLLDALPGEFDLVVVDLPNRLAAQQRRLLALCHSVVIVTDMSVPGMRDTARLAQLVRDAAPEAQISVVVNRTGANKSAELPKAEFVRGIEMPVKHFVPFDPKVVGQAINSGKPLAAINRKAEVVTAMRGLCETMCGGRVSPVKEPLIKKLLPGHGLFETKKAQKTKQKQT